MHILALSKMSNLIHKVNRLKSIRYSHIMHLPFVFPTFMKICKVEASLRQFTSCEVRILYIYVTYGNHKYIWKAIKLWIVCFPSEIFIILDWMWPVGNQAICTSHFNSAKCISVMKTTLQTLRVICTHVCICISLHLPDDEVNMLTYT